MMQQSTQFSVDVPQREIKMVCEVYHHVWTLCPCLQRMYKGIGNSTPWLILAGSGGVADILVMLMNRGSWDTDSVHELLLDTFPNAHHSTDMSNWVRLVRAILTSTLRWTHHEIWRHSREACGSDADVSSASLKSTCDGLIKDLTRGEDINYIFLNWHSQ